MKKIYLLIICVLIDGFLTLDVPSNSPASGYTSNVTPQGVSGYITNHYQNDQKQIAPQQPQQQEPAKNVIQNLPPTPSNDYYQKPQSPSLYDKSVINELKDEVTLLRDNVGLLADLQKDLIYAMTPLNENNYQKIPEPSEVKQEYSKVQNYDDKNYKKDGDPKVGTFPALHLHHHRGQFPLIPQAPTYNYPAAGQNNYQQDYSPAIAPLPQLPQLPAIKSFRQLFRMPHSQRHRHRSNSSGRHLKGSGKSVRNNRGKSRKNRKSLRSTEIKQAERQLDSIRRGLMSAIWTGLIVVAVKLIPLLVLGFKIIFRSFIPIMGMGFLNKDKHEASNNRIDHDEDDEADRFLDDDDFSEERDDDLESDDEIINIRNIGETFDDFGRNDFSYSNSY